MAYIVIKEIHHRVRKSHTTLCKAGFFDNTLEPLVFETRESAEQMRKKIENHSPIYLCNGDKGGFYIVRKYNKD